MIRKITLQFSDPFEQFIDHRPKVAHPTRGVSSVFELRFSRTRALVDVSYANRPNSIPRERPVGWPPQSTCVRCE
jgi:hypothetical protein